MTATQPAQAAAIVRREQHESSSGFWETETLRSRKTPFLYDDKLTPSSQISSFGQEETQVSLNSFNLNIIVLPCRANFY